MELFTTWENSVVKILWRRSATFTAYQILILDLINFFLAKIEIYYFFINSHYYNYFGKQSCDKFSMKVKLKLKKFFIIQRSLNDVECIIETISI